MVVSSTALAGAKCKYDPRCEDYKYDYKAKVVIKHKYPIFRKREPVRKDGFHLRQPMGNYPYKSYHGTWKIENGEMYWKTYD